MSTMTMVARHVDAKGKEVAYALITDSYQIVTVSAEELKKSMQSNSVSITNLELVNGEIASTNGALNRYTTIDVNSHQIIGSAKAVILDRAEKNGKLIGYTILTANGTIAEKSVAEAAELVNAKVISNGKVRHTAEGDIVSAIGGTYPLKKIVDTKNNGEISVAIIYFATAAGVNTDYFGAVVSTNSALEAGKLKEVLDKSNSRVISESVKVAGKGVEKSLRTSRFDINSVYGVFEISLLDKLVKAGAKMSIFTGNHLIVSALEYVPGTESGEAKAESTVSLSKEWHVTDRSNSTTLLDNKVSALTKEIIAKFGNNSLK